MADKSEIVVTLLNSLKIRLKCAICLDVIIDVVELRCGHKYCVKCYDGLKENSQPVKCPLCSFIIKKRTSHYRDKFWNSLGHFVKIFDNITNEKCELTKTNGEQELDKSKSKSLKKDLVASWLSDSKNVFNRQSQTQDASQSTSCDNQFNLPSVSQLNKPRRSGRQQRLHRSLEIELKKPSDVKRVSEGAELSKSFTTTMPALSKTQQQVLEDELLEKLVKEIPKSPKKKKKMSKITFLQCSDRKGWKRMKELGKSALPRSQKQLKVQINKGESGTTKTSQWKESQRKRRQNEKDDLSKDLEIIQNKGVIIEEPTQVTEEKNKTSPPFKGFTDNVLQNKSYQQKCSDHSSCSVDKTLHLNAIVTSTESKDYSNANDLLKDLEIIQNKNGNTEESFRVPKEDEQTSQSLKGCNGKKSQQKSSQQKQSYNSLVTVTKLFDLNNVENFMSKNISILMPEPDSSKNKSKEDTTVEEDEAFLLPTQRLNIVCKKRESLNEDFDDELNLPTQKINISELENNIVSVECTNIIGMLESKMKILQECSKDVASKQILNEINYCIQQLKKPVNNVEKSDVSVQFDTLNYVAAVQKVDVGVQSHTEFCVKETQTNVASKDVFVQIIPQACEKEVQVDSQTDLKPDCQDLSSEELKQIFQNSNFNEENNLTNAHVENPVKSTKQITNKPNEELFANSWDNLNFNTEDILKGTLHKLSQKCIEQALEIDNEQNQVEQSSQLILTLQSGNKRSRNVEIAPGNCDSDEEIKPVKKKNRFVQEDLSIEINTCNTEAVNCNKTFNNTLNKIDSEKHTAEVVEERPNIWQECDDIINFVNKNISKLVKKSSEKESESDFIAETEYPEPVIKKRKVSKLDQAFDKGEPTEYKAVQEFHNCVADEAFEDIFIPVAPKINIISNVVVQGPVEEENLFSDDDIVESTPPRIEENDIPCEEINLALPPPPGFEDEEELPSNKENLPQQSQLQADAFRSPIPNLMLLKKLDHSTPFTQNHQHESLNLSPITLCSQKVLSTPKRSSSRMSIMSSIAGQKSMWNFLKTSKESQDEIKSQQKQKPHLSGTRLNQSQTRVIKELANKGLFTFTDTFNDDVTHLIVKVDAKNRLKEYTLKYIKAIARGIWVLKYEWVLECLHKNKIVPEELYEILDDSSQNGPKMARLKIKTEPLFGNFKFFCCNPFMMTTKEDTEEIIRRLGGTVYNKIVDMLENDGKIPLIIVDDQETQNVDTYTRWLELYKIVAVDFNWLTQSVGRYKVLSIVPFMYCTDECLQELNYPEYLTENMPPTIE